MRRQIQIAAAPGERIVVDDRLLRWGLGHAGSALLREEVAQVSVETGAEEVMAGHAEIVLVVAEKDPLAEHLRRAGCMLVADQMALPIDLLGRKGVQIWFVVGERSGL